MDLLGGRHEKVSIIREGNVNFDKFANQQLKRRQQVNTLDGKDGQGS